MSRAQKVVTSAVVISPPVEQWGPIQAIREKHDKAFPRWLPTLPRPSHDQQDAAYQPPLPICSRFAVRSNRGAAIGGAQG